MKELQNYGFFIIKNLISADIANLYLTSIKDKILESSQELGISVSVYLNCTGRWGDLSPITKTLSQPLNKIVQNKLEAILQCHVLQKKSNVICKTADLVDAVPFHQDISYNFNNPYHFSVWLALNEVDTTSGALRIIRNSHTWPIEPAVDFWSPYFIDKHLDKVNSQEVLTLPITAGDAIVFDSRIWHGSGENCDSKDRFAYVTRWTIKDKRFPTIPKPRPSPFGMFNCGLLTKLILTKSLSFFKLPHNLKEKNSEHLIEAWLAHLKNTPYIPEIEAAVASKDLFRLLILQHASTIHDAGDISGKIHKNLWFSLLSILNAKVQVVKNL